MAQYRFHLSTMLICTLLAALLIGLNMLPRVLRHDDFMCMEMVSFGWPWAYRYQAEYFRRQPDGTLRPLRPGEPLEEIWYSLEDDSIQKREAMQDIGNEGIEVIAPQQNRRIAGNTLVGLTLCLLAGWGIERFFAKRKRALA